MVVTPPLSIRRKRSPARAPRSQSLIPLTVRRRPRQSTRLTDRFENRVNSAFCLLVHKMEYELHQLLRQRQRLSGTQNRNKNSGRFRRSSVSAVERLASPYES